MLKATSHFLSPVILVGFCFLCWASETVAQDHEEEETLHEPEIETESSSEDHEEEESLHEAENEAESSSQGHEEEEESSLQEVEPTHGTHDLRSGFSRSPREFEVEAGGSVSGLEITGLMNCTGFFEETVDIRLNYRAREAELLRIYVDDPTDQDTSLAIYGPDNTWFCNDDFDLTLQPVIDFQSPMSGDYDIYVGHYFADTLTEVILYLTEDAETDRPALPLSGLNDN